MNYVRTVMLADIAVGLVILAFCVWREVRSK